jgi:hypothetical protein
VHTRTRPRRALDRAVFHPPRALGVITSAGFAAWAFVIAGVCFTLAIGSPVDLRSFIAWVAAVLLVGVGVVFASWTYCLASLSYRIEPDALIITWGLRQVVVPIEAIQRMVPGRTLDEPKVEGLNWWGAHVGSADVKRMGYTLFYSTHSSPEDILYIVTTDESYAITVLDQAAFAEQIQSRAALEPVDQIQQRSTAFGLAAFPFWRDRAAMATALTSGFLCALLAGFVYSRYPSLPDVIQLDFPAVGGIVRVGAKSEILRIAHAGVGILAANTLLGVAVHARERAAGLWLLASGGILQVLLLGAAIVAFVSN